MNNSVTAADVRKMNRDDLDAQAESMGINPGDYTRAEDLRDEVLKRLEGGDNGDDGDKVQKQETTVETPDRSATLTATIRPVEHNKGRRIVNYVEAASIEKKDA